MSLRGEKKFFFQINNWFNFDILILQIVFILGIIILIY